MILLGFSVGGKFSSHTIADFAPVFPASSAYVSPVNPDEVRSISPGSYAWLTINSRARLYLRSGAYYFQGLQVEPGATVHFGSTNGPVRIFVKDSLMHKGAFSGDPTAILIGYVGSAAVHLEGKFLGTLIAPSAFVNVPGRNIVGGNEVTGEGTIYAKYIELHQDALWVHRPFTQKWLP